MHTILICGQQPYHIVSGMTPVMLVKSPADVHFMAEDIPIGGVGAQVMARSVKEWQDGLSRIKIESMTAIGQDAEFQNDAYYPVGYIAGHSKTFTACPLSKTVSGHVNCDSGLRGKTIPVSVVGIAPYVIYTATGKKEIKM